MTKFPFFLPYGRRGNVCRDIGRSFNGRTLEFGSKNIRSTRVRPANVEVLRTRRELEKFGNRAV